MEKKFGAFEAGEGIRQYLERKFSEDNNDPARFIFIIDEWDAPFYKTFMDDTAKGAYIDFLNALLKNQPYVKFVYMTGILPISKYAGGSALNMFKEFNMASTARFVEHFGFSDQEVDELYGRYLDRCADPLKPVTPKVTREKLKNWYDGYYWDEGRNIYNPRSIVCALEDNQLTGPGPAS